jgi:hypothetical protein
VVRTRLFGLGLALFAGCVDDDAAPLDGARDRPDTGTCEGPNPSLASAVCIPAINGVCSGDNFPAMICVDSAWVCPPGTLERLDCSSFRNPFDAGPIDLGTIDTGAPDGGDGDGTCTTINPSLAPERLYCVYAENGICCGDLGYAMICTQGTWACETGQIPYTQCIGNCFDQDAGSAD